MILWYERHSLRLYISNSEAIDSKTIFVPGFSNATFSDNLDLSRDKNIVIHLSNKTWIFEPAPELYTG